MIRNRLLVQILVAAGCLVASTASQALIITNSNVNNFDWSFNGGAAGTLWGDGTIQVGGLGTTSLTVAVRLNNRSADASDRLTSFGFGINPNARSVSFSDAGDGGLVGATLNNIPSLALIEVCAFGGNNCSGGANGGIYGGAWDQFSLVLTSLAGTTWGSSIDLSPIGFKYQTAAGSREFTTDRPPTSVPEPATLSLLGAGLLLAGLSRKRKQNA